MKFPRRSGILLHPTSLPGPYGIGDMGEAAYRFIDWLVAGGQQLWQVLPLGPTGYGDSPYQSLSAFAGNPMLISPALLVEGGWLPEEALHEPPAFPEDRVDYGWVIGWKGSLLRQAFGRWEEKRDEGAERWLADNAAWLEDYALFIALKEKFGGGSWVEWPEPLRRREADALEEARHALGEEIEYHKFVQHLFARQWAALHDYARANGVALVGDVPIFIAHDSADAWANQAAFTINEDGSLALQAGVPPDYFSETGQLWGNPLYRWEVMADNGYGWWVERIRTMLELVDIVRLDHFRGFEAYWAVPGDAETAEPGDWEPGPGTALFNVIKEELGTLPIIAEDLGVITPEVDALRHEFDFPGMRILQFAFTADEKAAFLPHLYEANTVAYTGTHDNETTVGWFEGLADETREQVLDYFDSSPAQIVRAMIRALMGSVADSVIFPLQDLFELDNRARMNHPGTSGGNWQWRATTSQFTDEQSAWLAHLCYLYDR